jgi:hypothetical protein
MQVSIIRSQPLVCALTLVGILFTQLVSAQDAPAPASLAPGMRVRLVAPDVLAGKIVGTLQLMDEESVTGIRTPGVVLSTLLHAADMDYRAVVVDDGCSDKDPEVQRVLMEKIFPLQAKIATVEECIGAIP